jgi:hypothetical protein
MNNKAKYLFVGIGVIILCVGSYLFGKASATERWTSYAQDALTMQRLLWIRTDLDNLTLLRQGKVEETVQGIEGVVKSGLETLDVDRATVAPLSGLELLKTKEALVQYRKRFPATELDPKKNPKISGIISK